MSVYEFGPFRLDADHLLLVHGAEPVPLGPKVVETLLALVESAGETLSKSALMARVWPDGYVEQANLAQNIYVLRRALRVHWKCEAILTVPRRGYRFAPIVRLGHSAGRAIAPVRSRWRFAAAAIAAFALAGFTIAAVSVSRDRPLAQPPLSAQGARLYAIAQYYWNQRTQSGVLKSLQYFSEVVRSDPHDARGYAGLADANAIAGNYGYGALRMSAYNDRARAYARKALALDPNSAAAYAILGLLDADAQPNRGIALLQRAIALDPSYGPAHQWYGEALLEKGRAPDALRELKIAAQLDPLSVSTTAWLSDAAYLDRQYGDAITYARQALDLSPKRYDELTVLGVAYEQRGDYRDAIVALRTFAASCRDCGPEADALLADVYARMHDVSRARSTLAIARRSGGDTVSPADVAVALASMGQRAEAIAWFSRLKRKYQVLAALDPRLDVLRDDAKFREFARPA
jgi:DNA-binding winged helix-turn-helix (wHTH) protein/predicted Zn-dependent protease